MIDAARLALALAPLLALWAVVASLAMLRTGRADLGATGQRGLVAATACAWVALAVLVTVLVRDDLSVRFVADYDSVLMPGRYLVASVLGAPGGALLAWSALGGAAVLASGAPAAPGAPGDYRAWTTLVVAAAMGIALLVVSTLADPFAAATGVADGAGLPPDLQRGGAVLHAAALFVGAVAALPAFATTVAALAARALDARWHRTVRAWNAVAWSTLFVGAIAGVRWFALNPARGAWLADGDTSAWLFPVVIGAWLVHLDAARPTPERVTMRVLLVAAILVSTTAAMAIAGGAFVRGGAGRVPVGAGAGFALAPLTALVLTIALVRGGRSAFGALARRQPAELPRAAVAGWIAHAGLVLVLGAAVGSWFTRSTPVSLADAGVLRVKDPFGHRWSFASQGVSTLERTNYGSLTMSLMPERDGKRLRMLSAEVRSYFRADNGETPDVAGFTSGVIKGAFLETRLAIEDPDSSPPRIRITFVPLATWIWPGAVLLVLGTLLPLAGSGEVES